MANLSDVCTPHPVPVDGRFQLEVAAGWRQGRGAFGGLVVGALVRAIEQQVADPARKVRSVTAELPGPVEQGTAEIVVETLRRGNNVSTVRAALSQAGEIRSHAVAILGASRGTADEGWNDLARPDAAPWSAIEPVNMAGVGPWPEFARHFEYRVVEGLPMAGGAARALGWVRAREPGARLDAAYIAAMIDAWWPTAFNRATAPHLMATIAFTLDIIAGVEGLDPATPLLYRAAAPVCAGGYFLETRELWGSDGRLIAINHQTFAIISGGRWGREGRA
jgi:acyl-CoA thioesterase